MHDIGAHNLMYGIIERAVNDYRDLLMHKRPPQSDCNIRELENFFHSEWFALLTDYKIDPDWLIKTIREQAGVGHG